MQEEKKIRKALVIDVDAHKGDGTAEICQNDDSIFTFSIHMVDSWPFPDETVGCHVSSNVDIEISKENSHLYLDKLKDGLSKIDVTKYDIAVIVAGADPYEHDELSSTASLKLTKEDMLIRDMMIYKTLEKLPQAWLMAGGYGQKSHEIYEQFLMKVFHFKTS